MALKVKAVDKECSEGKSLSKMKVKKTCIYFHVSIKITNFAV